MQRKPENLAKKTEKSSKENRKILQRKQENLAKKTFSHYNNVNKMVKAKILDYGRKFKIIYI